MIESLRNALGSGSLGTKVAIGAAVVAGVTLGTAGAVMAAPGHHQVAATKPAATVHHAKTNSHQVKVASHHVRAKHGQSATSPDPVPTVTPTSDPTYTDDDQYGDDDSTSPTTPPSYNDDDQGEEQSSASDDQGDSNDNQGSSSNGSSDEGASND
jgi:hypothetical protein